MTAPFNTPPALGREPMTIAFWAICAPFLFPVIIMAIAAAIFPTVSAISEGTPSAEALRMTWLAVCVSGVLQFAALSAWLRHIGAGPFGGSMQLTPQWILIALVIGPLLLIIPSSIVAGLMAGQEGWQFSGDVNEAVFARENWTLGYILFAVLIAPVVEEVTFRGAAMGGLLARGLSPYGAAIISSAVFAAIHLQYSPAAMAVVFMTGLGFAVLRLISGTVSVPILAHMAANGNMLLLQTLVTGPSS